MRFKLVLSNGEYILTDGDYAVGQIINADFQGGIDYQKITKIIIL